MGIKVDHRSMERFPMKLRAKLFSVEEQSALPECETNDVSAGGAFLNLPEAPLEEGSPVQIELILPFHELEKMEGKRVHIQLSGEVVRRVKNGVAVKFERDYMIRPLPASGVDALEGVRRRGG